MFRRLINHCITPLLAALTLSLPLAQAAEPADIVVPPGTQRPYTHETTIRRIAVGDPKVASVTLTSARSLLITGKQQGSTTLLVWGEKDKAGPAFQARIVVAPDNIDDGLNVEGSGERLKISGTLSSLESHHATIQGLGKDADPVDTSRSTFDTQVQIDIKVVEVSRKRLMNAGFFLGKNNGAMTRAISGPGNLSGVSSTAGTADSPAAITLTSASGFMPFLKSYNLVWGGAQKGLLGALSVLEEDGFAYTLAEPSLTAISGQTASFLAGGEVPIPQRTGTGAESSTTIRYKEFGVKLALTPTVLDQNRIFLKVAPEVSEIDDTLSVQVSGLTIPGLRVRRTDTSVALGDGESFVLSGLVSRNTTADVAKFPMLADIPILGAFMRSTRFERSDKELLMVVTAHLVRPFAKAQPLPPLPGEGYRDYNPSFPELMFMETGRFNSSTGFSD